jgi:light-regulated signal transduction histidine kinase (bacteriophytochrome)
MKSLLSTLLIMAAMSQAHAESYDVHKPHMKVPVCDSYAHLQEFGAALTSKNLALLAAVIQDGHCPSFYGKFTVVNSAYDGGSVKVLVQFMK